mmetsp:Transcript_172678/g.553430  ORF Transcript_172678/g.553430 Transcript_172678/m.553430 type:complete len:355 (+) Transcript_172678:1323-2387(+)
MPFVEGRPTTLLLDAHKLGGFVHRLLLQLHLLDQTLHDLLLAILFVCDLLGLQQFPDQLRRLLLEAHRILELQPAKACRSLHPEDRVEHKLERGVRLGLALGLGRLLAPAVDLPPMLDVVDWHQRQFPPSNREPRHPLQFPDLLLAVLRVHRTAPEGRELGIGYLLGADAVREPQRVALTAFGRPLVRAGASAAGAAKAGGRRRRGQDGRTSRKGCDRRRRGRGADCARPPARSGEDSPLPAAVLAGHSAAAVAAAHLRPEARRETAARDTSNAAAAGRPRRRQGRWGRGPAEGDEGQGGRASLLRRTAALGEGAGPAAGPRPSGREGNKLQLRRRAHRRRRAPGPRRRVVVGA